MDISILLSVLGRFAGFFGCIGGNSFPRPLNAEQERQMVQRMAQGDTGAADTLIEHNLRLVAHIAKKFAGSGIEQDDLVAIGSIGLIKAVRTYDASRGNHLATYAARCIENEIRMTLRSIRRQQNEISLQEPIGTDKEGNQISLADILGSDGEDIVEQVDFSMRLAQLLRQIDLMLSKRERAVIIMRYGINGQPPMPQKDVAKQLNISRSYVSRIEKKALLKLKEYFDEDGM